MNQTPFKMKLNQYILGPFISDIMSQTRMTNRSIIDILCAYQVELWELQKKATVKDE